MAKSLPKTTSHVRSSSVPSTSLLLPSSNIEDLLHRRLNASDIVLSSSTSSICYNLSDIKSLYEGINDSIQCPSNQQLLSLDQHRDGVKKVLEGSLGLLDACGSTIDVLSSMKESILVLESSLRRKSGAYEKDINAYMVSRKKIHKMANKSIKNLPKVNLNKDDILIPIVRILREAEAISNSTLKSVLVYLSEPKVNSKGRSLVAKLMHPKHVSCDRQVDVNEIEKIDEALCALKINSLSIDTKMAQDLLKQLAILELGIQEIEECFKSISRCLLRTRVFLLNILSQ